MTPIIPPGADPRFAAAHAAPRAAGNEAALARTAREFEAMALGALLQPMFEGLGAGGAFGGGAGEEMWRPMLVNEFARAVAEGGGLGLGDAVMREMITMQEQAR